MKNNNLKIDIPEIFSKGRRHDHEIYSAVIDNEPGSSGLIWLEVCGTREKLVYQKDSVSNKIYLSNETYILSPCFAGDYIVWVENQDKNWAVRAVNKNDPASGKIFSPFECKGRPVNLSYSGKNNNSVLVFEERSGKKTKIGISIISSAGFSKPEYISDGTFNAYDPSVAICDNGNIFVAFCGFFKGNYRIFIQSTDRHGKIIGEPKQISNSHAACVYPSISARKSGGCLFSFTAYDKAVSNWDRAFIQHSRLRDQHSFFSNQGRVYAGIFLENNLFSIVPASAKSGKHDATMYINGTDISGHSRIIEDTYGGVHLLFRNHSLNKPVTEIKNFKSLFEEKGLNIENSFIHPNISVISLNEKGWTDPEVLVSKAHFESPITMNEYNGKISTAFTVDGRLTGWSNHGEWFDSESEVAVGIINFIAQKKENNYSLSPFYLAPVSGGNIENPLPKQNRKLNNGLYTAIGQTHTHSNLSVCNRSGDKTPDFNYRFSQDVQHCDFCTVTDHAYNMWHTEMLLIRKLADYYYFPDEFVAIPGYEWTGSAVSCCSHENGPWGHVNPLFLEEDGDLDFFTPSDPNCPGGSLKRTWEAYKGKKILTPPHHVADFEHKFNWNVFDENFIPVVELFQDFRGSGEKNHAPGLTNYSHAPDNNWIAGQLLAGKRFGFIGGADHGGVAIGAVLVEELTRTGIYEGLKSRHAYALCGACIYLSFSCNGFLMGASVKTRTAKFLMNISSAETIKEVQILRNTEIIKTVPVDSLEKKIEWEIKQKESGEFWYARIILENGEMAWSSPIWLD